MMARTAAWSASSAIIRTSVLENMPLIIESHDDEDLADPCLDARGRRRKLAA
jgi:hypothetical protein